MDTQLIRNAYLQRPMEDLHVGFGHWVANYLRVNDNKLRKMMNVNDVCNYILAKGYNK